jgi:transposase
LSEYYLTSGLDLYSSGFVPPTPIRELRDLTRMRASLRQDYTAVANRMQKILEDANIKLAAVASDWLGVSGRAILTQLLAGEEDAEKLAALSRGRLRSKLPAMQLALEGRMTEHHRWLLRVLHEQLVFFEAQITKLEAKIQDQVCAYQEAVGLCTTIPGIEEVAAADVPVFETCTCSRIPQWYALKPAEAQTRRAFRGRRSRPAHNSG